MENSIDKSFKDSIASDKALDIAKDFLEIGLDSLLKDGLLKEIPIIGTILGFGKIAWSIKDKQTLKKIAIFLSRLSDVSSEEREDFAKKLTEDKFKETISEKILLVIERLDETAKAEIIGNLFALYIKEAISKQRFLRYSNIVERAYIYDLLGLYNRYCNFDKATSNIEIVNWSAEIEQNLYSLGLLNQILPEKNTNFGLTNRANESLKMEFEINFLGSNLANIMYYNLADEQYLQYVEHLKDNLRGELSFYVPQMKFR